MHRKSELPRTNKLEWLHESYVKRKTRSLKLGVKAIDALIKENKPVSYRTVSDKSKEIDPDGVGIHQNTIRTNQELRKYFLKHSTNKDYKTRQSSQLEEDLDAFKYIKQDRDLDRVRQRYLKLTKQELVDLLIRMEQYIAYQNQHWLKNEFEKYKS